MIVNVNPTIKLTEQEKDALYTIAQGIEKYCDNVETCHHCIFNTRFCSPTSRIDSLFEEFLDFMVQQEKVED